MTPQLATRMATFGQLQEYRPNDEGIAAYLECVELYSEVNDIAAAKQVAVFLSIVGGRAYLLLRDLLTPEKQQCKTFKELAETLQAHFEPKPLVISEKFYFHSRSQKMSESITKFVAELHRTAMHCKFGNYLNDALRDWFVCGLAHGGSSADCSRRQV